MKIGSSLNLDITDQETNEIVKCESKVIGKNEDCLFIDYPVNIKTRKTVLLREGTTAFASFIDDNRTPHYFKTKVLKRVKLTIPALAIKLPEKKTIKKIQRREYVRVQTAIDIAVYCPKQSFTPFTTVSLDISGGGASLIIPSKQSLKNINKLNMWMVLQMQSGEYQYIYSQAKIIRYIQLKHNRQSISLKYTSIEPKAKQTIIQFCFEKLRQSRQKGLI